MNKQKKEMDIKHRKDFWAIFGSVILMMASTAIFVYKYMEKKAHDERWKDYDECGI